MLDVLVIGGGSCGLTATWLLENLSHFKVTLVEKSARLGGHIDTRRYQCISRLISYPPKSSEIELVRSLHEILFTHQLEEYTLGFCNHQGEYQEVKITSPVILEFLKSKPDGVFAIENPFIEKFNELLRQSGSCQRVSVYVVETGTEFIGNKKSYPLFNIICEHFQVTLKKFRLTAQFDGSDGQTIMLPPKLPVVEKSASSHSFFTAENNSIFHELVTLFNTEFVIIDAEKKFRAHHEIMTLKAFVDLFIAQGQTGIIKQTREKFANNFLYPLLAAGWGVSIEEIKEFIAHYAMNYLALGESWMDVPDGLDTYIDKMRNECLQAEILTSTEVKKLEPILTASGLKYKASTLDGLFLKDGDGQDKLFDYVILAVPANVTCELLPDTSPFTDLKSTLSKVSYYPTRIITHRDPKYMSKDQYIVHTIVSQEGQQTISANTTCKYRNYDREIPVFRSWVLSGQQLPNNIIEEIHYQHPVIDINYYSAQQALHHSQDLEGLYFGNIIAGFNDSNESTQSAAIRIAYYIYKSLLRDVALPSIGFNRFNLFSEYLHKLEFLDAQSEQLGATDIAKSELHEVISLTL